jgi:type II secretory pathway pseudopilin PulG
MKNKQLKGLGFIEVLIAIVVVGIVSAVFLSIAGDSMKDLIQTERIEYMARIAKDGFNVAQEVANQEKANTDPTQNYFPDDEDFCYIPLREEGEETTYKFMKESGDFISFVDPLSVSGKTPIPPSNREAIVSLFNEEFGESRDYFWGEYFMIMCITRMDTSTSNWANVYFLVGDRGVAGQKTDSTDVRDFIYYSVIEL